MFYRKVEHVAWFALSLAAVLPIAACGSSGQESEAAEANGDFVRTVNVEVATVTPIDFTSFLRLTGEVGALNDVTMSAEESGVIERFYVEKGKFVRQGTEIAKIRDRVLQAQVDEAAAASGLATERYERQRRLWEEEKIGSEITYLEAKYQAELQLARLQTLRARLQRTTLRSPISGIFDERYVDVGEMVAPGTPVVRIVEIARLKVTVGVPERFALQVRPGVEGRIRLDVLPGQEFVGVILYVGSAVDQRNRTFPIEIEVENPGRVIKPRMVANVEVPADRLTDVLVVPQAAVLRTEAGYQVFVAVQRDGELSAEARSVKLGPSYANRTVIAEGLEAGDQVVVRGQQLVESGNRVRIVNSDTASS
jgi:RND family efflux transporter MFP subunit